MGFKKEIGRANFQTLRSVVNKERALYTRENFKTLDSEEVNLNLVDEIDLPENNGPFDPRNDENGRFGGDQGSLNYNIEQFIADPVIRKIVYKYYPEATNEDLELLFYRMNSCGCGYIATINTVFEECNFHNEIDFWERFGFNMRTNMRNEETGEVYSTFNYEYLFLDFFLYFAKNINGYNTIEEVYGNAEEEMLIRKKGGDAALDEEEFVRTGMWGTTLSEAAEVMQQYLAEKGIELEIENKSFYEYSHHGSKLDLDSIKRLIQEGKQINVALKEFNLYYPYDNDGNGKLDDVAHTDVGSHGMTVVGVLDDNKIVVSSWGHEYIIDLNQDSIMYFEIYDYGDFEPLISAELANEIDLPENSGPFNPRNNENKRFGGNQEFLYDNFESFRKDSVIKRILDKYYPETTEEDLKLLFDCMQKYGDDYIAGINTIFYEYIFYDEIDFWERFGFNMRTNMRNEETGDIYLTLNYEYLFLDFFLYYAKNQKEFNSMEEITSKSGTESLDNITTVIKKYLAEKGIELNTENKIKLEPGTPAWEKKKKEMEDLGFTVSEDQVLFETNLDIDIIKQLITRDGKQINITVDDFTLYYPYDKDGNGKLDMTHESGSFTMTVIDVLDDNKIIVSKEGEEFILDLNQDSIKDFVIYDYGNFS